MQLYRRQVQYDPQRVRQFVSDLNRFMEQFGYVLLELPIIESADLFLTKAGDQIVQKLFTFERHGQELALRPEFTAPAAHYYLTRHATQPVVRWQFSGPVFEDDPDDIARDYQRYSIGAELLGMEGPHAEAEVIAIAAKGMNILGISDWRLLIGHAGLTRQLLAQFNLDSRTQRFLLSHLALIKDRGKSYVLEQLHTSSEGASQLSVPDDSLRKLYSQQPLHALFSASDTRTAMGGRTREDVARRLLQKQHRVSDHEAIVSALDTLEQWVAVNAPPAEAFPTIERIAGSDETVQRIVNEWRRAIDLLSLYDVSPLRITIQPALARTWEYYTGIVFELRATNSTHLGGGGRYDELARLIGGQQDVPAVGFAYYLDQVLTTLPGEMVLPRVAACIVLDDNTDKAAVHWAQQLRQHSITVVLCPASNTAKEYPLLVVESDGCVRFGQKAYTPAQVSSLVADLNEMKS